MFFFCIHFDPLHMFCLDHLEKLTAKSMSHLIHQNSWFLKQQIVLLRDMIKNTWPRFKTPPFFFLIGPLFCEPGSVTVCSLKSHCSTELCNQDPEWIEPNTLSDLAKCERLFTAMALPQVYFDIKIGEQAAGRIVMEVR